MDLSSRLTLSSEHATSAVVAPFVAAFGDLHELDSRVRDALVDATVETARLVAEIAGLVTIRALPSEHAVFVSVSAPGAGDVPLPGTRPKVVALRVEDDTIVLSAQRRPAA